MGDVWVCDFYAQPARENRIIAWVTADCQEQSNEFQVEVYRKHNRGFPIAAEDLPSRMYGNYSDRKVGKLPPMFSGNGYLVVTEGCADVFRQFDLGQGGLYPVGIYENDQVTPVYGKYFIFNVGNQKETVVPDLSKNIKKMRGNTRWTPKFGLQDDNDIVVLSSSYEGADVWIDPEFRASIFLSDPICQTLQEKKMFGHVEVKRCRVLQA